MTDVVARGRGTSKEYNSKSIANNSKTIQEHRGGFPPPDVFELFWNWIGNYWELYFFTCDPCLLLQLAKPPVINILSSRCLYKMWSYISL